MRVKPLNDRVLVKRVEDAIVATLTAGEFLGEGRLAAQPLPYAMLDRRAFTATVQKSCGSESHRLHR
jgi:hypothetical protein